MLSVSAIVGVPPTPVAVASVLARRFPSQYKTWAIYYDNTGNMSSLSYQPDYWAINKTTSMLIIRRNTAYACGCEW